METKVPFYLMFATLYIRFCRNRLLHVTPSLETSLVANIPYITQLPSCDCLILGIVWMFADVSMEGI